MTELAVIREVASSAVVAPTAEVGPFCVVGPHVTIGPRTRLVRRVTVTGHTTIGADNVFDDGCAMGWDPQDLKYEGGATELVIGDRNTFGRLVTAHVGTEAGGGLTRIGSDCELMHGTHVAHDCFVDDGVTLGRYVQLAGHIRVETGAVLGDFAGAHHFTTIGRYARVGPRTPVRRDVPPYTDFYSTDPDMQPASIHGIHRKGLWSAKLPPVDEWELHRTLLELFADEWALQTRIEHLMNIGVEGEALTVCRFCQRSLRGPYGRHRETLRGAVPPEAKAYFASRAGSGTRHNTRGGRRRGAPDASTRTSSTPTDNIGRS